jgi:hypothetical protein
MVIRGLGVLDLILAVVEMALKYIFRLKMRCSGMKIDHLASQQCDTLPFLPVRNLPSKEFFSLLTEVNPRIYFCLGSDDVLTIGFKGLLEDC